MFILARFMAYKFVPPFNEMYIKLQQQHNRTEKDGLILGVMFDDLQAETYHVNLQGKLLSAKKDLERYKPGAAITHGFYRRLEEQHGLEPLLVKFKFIPAQSEQALSIHQ